MSADDAQQEHGAAHEPDAVLMPEPTAAPLVLALGVVLMAMGAAMGLAFAAVGAIVLAAGLGLWIRSLLPGHGHWHQPRVAPELRARPIVPSAAAVRRLQRGMPGYRLRLPEKVHPISAGIKGGIAGGLIMPLPAMLYGIVSGNGIWLPINLLAGMALPRVGNLTMAELDQFHPTLFTIGACIHVVVSLLFGLIYGVLLPTLPKIPKPISWGALLMPVLWTAASFIAMSQVSPLTRARVDWPWFMVSQFIFGLVAALVFMRAVQSIPAVSAGLLSGIVGGLLMPLPAVLWGWLSGHGIWYPVNLLSGMVLRNVDELSLAQLEEFHGDWLLGAIIVHAIFCVSFGVAYGIVLPRLPAIPAALAWGGLVMPIMWTASSYGLMGVVNPVLRERVDWPWFILSQFVFGVVAAVVVLRSEEVHIPPAGRGVDRADYVAN